MKDILCIGSVLWDVIGRTEREMRVGSDVPGRITQIPGGVALNVAMTLRGFGMKPVLISAVGLDRAGETLVAECEDLGLVTRHLYRSADLPTDRYMAIEGAGGLIAAIADAHSLEAAGDAILSPLRDGSLGSVEAPFSGIAALDGNLTVELLTQISKDPVFAQCDLRVAPASPGKARRLSPFVDRPSATLYVNLEEAGYLCDTTFATASEGAAALVARGALRALVTDGPRASADAKGQDVVTAVPPTVNVMRVTGAGDTFMAAHIASEASGADRANALQKALNAAAKYVSGEDAQ